MWGLSRVVTSTLEVTSNMQPLIPGLAAAACLDTTARWWTDPFPVNSCRGLETPGHCSALGCMTAIKKGYVHVYVCELLCRFVVACKCHGLFSAAVKGHKWFIMRICSPIVTTALCVHTCVHSCVSVFSTSPYSGVAYCAIICPIDRERFNY